MTHRATAGLLADVLSQAFRDALPPATRLIRFGETASAAWTTKAPLQQHQHDAVPSQRNIALASWARIMHFDAHPLTMWASRSVCRRDHFDCDTAILLKVLLENTQSSQFSWHHNPFQFCAPSPFPLVLSLLCAMLERHRLSSFDLEVSFYQVQRRTSFLFSFSPISPYRMESLRASYYWKSELREKNAQPLEHGYCTTLSRYNRYNDLDL